MKQLTFNPEQAIAINCEKGSSSWDLVHDETGIAGVAVTGKAPTSLFISSSQYRIGRLFLSFDTSRIPSGSVIDSATVRIYVVSKSNVDNDGDDWMNIVQTSQADPFILAAEDYDQCGAINNPIEGATRFDIGAIATGAYKTWTLNATGLLWINATPGLTLLGMREGHDAIDSPVGGGNNSITIHDEGDANPPELIVNFTPPARGMPIFFN